MLLSFNSIKIGTTVENTKLCDFTSTNNNDFICTPIPPPASKADFFEIKPALLNLVMKEQFSGVSTEDAAAHLNNFVELDRKSTRLNSSHSGESRMPSSA